MNINKENIYSFRTKLLIRTGFLFFIIAAGSPDFLYAQEKDPDSLLITAENTTDPEKKADLYNELFLRYEFSDYNKAGEYVNKALELSEKENYKKGLAVSYTHKAYLAEDTGNYMPAISYYEKAFRSYTFLHLLHPDEKTYKKSLSSVIGNLGSIYHRLGDYARTLEYYFFALKLDEETGDKEHLSTQTGNIGIVYYEMNEFEKANEYFQKAIKLDEQAGNKEGIARHLGNISNIYIVQGKYTDAITSLERALEISEKNSGKSAVSAWTGNLAQVYEEMAGSPASIKSPYVRDTLYNISIRLHLRSLELAIESGDQKSIATKYANIGFAYSKMAKEEKKPDEKNRCYRLSEEYLKKALAMTKEMELLKESRGIEEYLAELYAGTSRFDLAYHHYKNYITLRDSVFNETNLKRTIIAEVNFDYEKKKAVAEAEYRRKEELAEAEKKKQLLVIVAIGSGLVIVVFFFILLFNRFRVIKKQKNIIQRQKELVDEKNREILDSIAYAKRLQEAILPPKKLVKEYLEDSFILYKPKDIVAGDFYFLEPRDNKIIFAAADCTGHGVPGAMVSVVCSNALNRAVKEFGLTDPGKILNKVRELVTETFSKSESEVKDGMDISLCTLDMKNKVLLWAGANNPLWIIKGKSHEAVGKRERPSLMAHGSLPFALKEYKPDKQPIGSFAHGKPFETHNIQLESGDSIFIFTDGYADQFGGTKGKKFKASNMKELFLSIKDKSMEKQRELINDAFEKWKGELEQVDDVCIIGVRL